MAEVTENQTIPAAPTAEERIANLEKTNALILEALGKLASTPAAPATPAPKMDIMAMLPLIQSLGGNKEESTMDSFFNDLGKRAFFNVFDKALPSRKEIRGALVP